jgi:hypothetical protein
MKLIENVIDFGDARDVRVDGISGIYQISHNTICIEFYANKIVDGKASSCATSGTDRAGSLQRRSCRSCARGSSTFPVPAATTTRCACTDHEKSPRLELAGAAANPVGVGGGGRSPQT